MSKYKFIKLKDEDQYYPDPEHVEFEFETGDFESIVATFKRFLIAVGYHPNTVYKEDEKYDDNTF